MNLPLKPKQLRLLWSLVEHETCMAYERGAIKCAEHLKSLLFTIEQSAGYVGYDLITLSKLPKE